MAKKKVYVTVAQAKAASALVSRSAKSGRFVSNGTRKIANATIKPGVIRASVTIPTPRISTGNDMTITSGDGNMRPVEN